MSLPNSTTSFNPNTTSGYFGQIPQGLLAHPDVSDSAKVLFSRLWCSSLGTQQRITKTLPELSSEFGVSYRTIKRHMAALKKSGYLVYDTSPKCHRQTFQLLRSGAKSGTSEVPTLAPLPIYRKKKENKKEAALPDEENLDMFTSRQRAKMSDLRVYNEDRRDNVLAKKADKAPPVEKILLDPADRASWDFDRVLRYYLQRYRQTFPSNAGMSKATILSNKATGQIRELHKYLKHDGDKKGEGIARLVEYIDFVFDNWSRLSESFKITSGTITAGILLGFRDSIYNDMTGAVPIQSSVARAATDGANDKSGFGAGTSDLL